MRRQANATKAIALSAVSGVGKNTPATSWRACVALRDYPLSPFGDVGADMGSHVHLSIFWPSYKLAQLVAVIERISGSSADFVLPPYKADVVARSVCGGWQINMNNRGDGRESALEWAGYIADQHAKHPNPPKIKGKAFGISEAIGKAARERARPMLEARKARYGWMAEDQAEAP